MASTSALPYVPKVAHFVERFPQPELQYVYDQILLTDDRHDRLLAGRILSTQGTPDAHSGPTRSPSRSLTARARGGRSAQLLDRVVNRLAPTIEQRVLGRFIARELRREPFEVLHAHFGMAATKVAPAAARLGVPLVTTFYGVDATACLEARMWRDRYELLFQLGSLFIVLTDQVVEPLVAAGCPRERVVTWDVGLDFSQYPVAQRRVDTCAPRLLCVARFVEKKGHNLLIPAFSQLRTCYPRATLTLMGYGPMLPEIRAAAVDHGVDDAVFFVDTTGDTDFYELFREALASHDVFVLPCVIASNGDAEAGPPLTLVCAQATAMPVVTTNFVGADRCVHDGETAIVCAPTSESVRDGLRRAVEDPAASLAMGIRASELVRRKMSLDAALQELEQHYRAVVVRKAG